MAKSKYRKVDVRIWNDAKFRDLSDRGKLAFIFLVTHPHMTSIGAMRATVSGLSEELGWDAKAFREAFAEALAKGMVEHDSNACFISLPNFLKYNQPESPNVVKAWSKSWHMIPECGLKDLLLQRVKAFAEGLPKAFAKAFREAFAEVLGEAFPKGMPYQEQEQEQEQEQDIDDRYVAGRVSIPSDQIRPEVKALERRLGRNLTSGDISQLQRLRMDLEANPVDVGGSQASVDDLLVAAIQAMPPDVRIWNRYVASVIDGCRADGVMPGDASPSNRGTFKPPTVAEVEAYCRENKCKVDAAAFVSHYEAVGWKRGGNQITDWRAQVRAWDARRRSEESDPSSPNYVPKLKDGWED